MSIFGPLHGFAGVFQGLSGMLVAGQMIFFAVVCGGSAVRVGSLFVEFSSSLVRVIWHGVPAFGGKFSVCAATREYCAMLDSRAKAKGKQWQGARPAEPIGGDDKSQTLQ
jgi:hypothetical protein